MHVLITCCGRKAYLIEEFRRSLSAIRPHEQHKISVSEADPLSASRFAADAFWQAPRISHPSYIDFIVELCRREKVDFLLPTKDTELRLLAENIDRLTNTILPLSSAHTLRVCEDKLLFYAYIREKFRTPLTLPADEWSKAQMPLPVVVKENGLGIETSGAIVCESKSKVLAAIKLYKRPIVQSLAVGNEYTVDCLFDQLSKPIAIIPRRRLRLRHNVSDVGLARSDESIESCCIRLGRFLGLVGAANIQLMVTSGQMEPTLIEVNPRISGGLQITLAACPGYFDALVREALRLPNEPLQVKEPMLVMKFDSVISGPLPKDLSDLAFS